MLTTATNEAGDDFADLTKGSPSRTQMLLALGVVPGILVAVFCISRPFAEVQLRAVDAFVPIYVTAMFLNGLTTAVILFAQYSILQTRSLLAIANGYLFLGLMAIPYTLSFPGVFEPGRSLIGGLQSTPWLYILRHCGFAIFLSIFALLKNSGMPYRHRQRNVNHTILLSVAMTTAVVLAMAAQCIVGEARLPIVIGDRLRFDATWIYYAGAPIATLYILALILL